MFLMGSGFASGGHFEDPNVATSGGEPSRQEDSERRMFALQATIKERPNLISAQIELGRLYLRLGDKARAVDQLRKAVAANPQSADAHDALGTALRQNGELDNAILEFRRAVSIQSNVFFLRNLAQALRDQHDWGGALDCHQKIVSLEPNSGEAYVDLGYVLRRSDRLSEALTALRKGVTLAPELARGHFYLAEALSQTGESSEAILEYERAVGLNPKDPEFSFKYAVALSKNRLPDAIVELRRAVELDPENPAVRRALGRLLGRNGDLQGASSELGKADALSSEAERHSEAVIHNKTAIQHLRKSDFSGAIKELRLALSTEPDSADANHLLGVALSGLGKSDEARQAFASALEERPSDPEIHFNFGVFLGNQADWKGATQEFRSALALKPSHSQARCLLATALARMGDAEGARDELVKARELGKCSLESISDK
jgi:Flp pilus assembly protein TadD